MVLPPGESPKLAGTYLTLTQMCSCSDVETRVHMDKKQCLNDSEVQPQVMPAYKLLVS